MCFLQSTVRAEVTFVPSTKGIESSGNDSGAHGKLEQQVESGRCPPVPGSEVQCSGAAGIKPTRTAPWLVGTRQVVMAQVTGSQLAPGFLPLLRAGLFPAVPGASFQEVVWGLRTGTEHCPNESWGPPPIDKDNRARAPAPPAPGPTRCLSPWARGGGSTTRQHFLLTCHGLLSGLASTPERQAPHLTFPPSLRVEKMSVSSGLSTF